MIIDITHLSASRREQLVMLFAEELKDRIKASAWARDAGKESQGEARIVARAIQQLSSQIEKIEADHV